MLSVRVHGSLPSYEIILGISHLQKGKQKSQEWSEHPVSSTQ